MDGVTKIERGRETERERQILLIMIKTGRKIDRGSEKNMVYGGI